jgi:rubredoxin
MNVVEEDKWKCEECGQITPDSKLLRAPNPFTQLETLIGCPHCKAASRFFLACDVEGCCEAVTGGFPSAAGYRLTCGAHNDDPE